MTNDNRAIEPTSEQVEAARRAWLEFPHKRGVINSAGAFRAVLVAAASAAPQTAGDDNGALIDEAHQARLRVSAADGDLLRRLAEALAATALPSSTAPQEERACNCTYHSEDRGGGYSELVVEPEPGCPEHGREALVERGDAYTCTDLGHEDCAGEHEAHAAARPVSSTVAEALRFCTCSHWLEAHNERKCLEHHCVCSKFQPVFRIDVAELAGVINSALGRWEGDEPSEVFVAQAIAEHLGTSGEVV